MRIRLCEIMCNKSNIVRTQFRLLLNIQPPELLLLFLAGVRCRVGWNTFIKNIGVCRVRGLVTSSFLGSCLSLSRRHAHAPRAGFPGQPCGLEPLPS